VKFLQHRLMYEFVLLYSSCPRRPEVSDDGITI
jgi:hypothetical protein